ncbi:unnamed protein product [Tuber melanosporum]|uniref:(Perigord truffle) hypothetical protein n=1 Tax=Tuber melanosporum (strain Mel28) TaxID=656061 RepID=D5GD02_TUBMM|nr:unnamed protein product [Tuber melanosporum]
MDNANKKDKTIQAIREA